MGKTKNIVPTPEFRLIRKEPLLFQGFFQSDCGSVMLNGSSQLLAVYYLDLLIAIKFIPAFSRNSRERSSWYSRS